LITQLEFEFFGELKNLSVKIPLIQAIKGVSIYNKVVNELCLKNPGIKGKDPQNIHVIG
jgi:hypothetical protein